MTQHPGASGLFGSPVCRRIMVYATVCWAVALVPISLQEGLAGAAVLTLISALSIVNFRALEVQVSLLEPRFDGRLGTRNGLLLALRLTFLAGLMIGLLLLGSEYLLSLIVGISVIPAALLAEGFLRAAGFERDTDGR